MWVPHDTGTYNNNNNDDTLVGLKSHLLGSRTNNIFFVSDKHIIEFLTLKSQLYFIVLFIIICSFTLKARLADIL